MQAKTMRRPRVHHVLLFLLTLTILSAGLTWRGATVQAAPADTPALGDLPDEVSFSFRIPDQHLSPATWNASPQNVGSQDILYWELTYEGSWFEAAPITGTTPASFWITPTAFVTDVVASYTGAITVTVTDPQGATGSPQRIDLSLEVTETYLVFLPLVLRNLGAPRTPNDPYYSTQWGPERIDAPAAWGYTQGRGVLVAVLDSGADLDHPDLAPKLRTDIDKDYVDDDDTAEEVYNSHGTHVAGTIAAATNNGTGVAGVAWDAEILPLKILDSAGVGYDADLAAAIRYAADNGAQVINMSVGAAGGCPEVLQQAADYAHARGVVLVAAAGNSLGHTEVFPASCRHVLGVAATEPDDRVSGYSTYGLHVNVAAPGSEIYSTMMGGGYGNKWGTSMASPHVAGVAALVFSQHPGYTPDQVASAILDTAQDLGPAGWDEYSGCGRVDAGAAVKQGAQAASPLCLQPIGPWAPDVSPPAEAAVEGELIVAFRAEGRKARLFASLDGTAKAEYLPHLGIWHLRVEPGQEEAVLAQLRADPAVAYADRVHPIFAQ